jgi:hypothetical protein
VPARGMSAIGINGSRLSRSAAKVRGRIRSARRIIGVAHEEYEMSDSSVCLVGYAGASPYQI